MQIEPHTLKSIKAQLIRGEIEQLARITGYSRVTVDSAFKGDSVTQATREIALAAKKLIAKRMKETAEVNAPISK